jgi:hypothetical protein
MKEHDVIFINVSKPRFSSEKEKLQKYFQKRG